MQSKKAFNDSQSKPAQSTVSSLYLKTWPFRSRVDFFMTLFSLNPPFEFVILIQEFQKANS